MPALAVIEHLDILGNGLTGFDLLGTLPMSHPLVLQRTEEAFDGRVVIKLGSSLVMPHFGLTSHWSGRARWDAFPLCGNLFFGARR